MILWSVVDCENESVIAYFKAAAFAPRNQHTGIQMSLCKPEWSTKTRN